MYAIAAPQSRVALGAASASAIAAMFVYECERDMPRVAMPRPEVQLVVRFGPLAENGLDVHAFGARERVHRKQIRRGQRTVTARLRLDATPAVLGVSAATMAGRIVALDDLWGRAATERLRDRLATARDTLAAAPILERAIAERVGRAEGRRTTTDRAHLVLHAADRLTSANVNVVADDLGVSERHLRRVFRETVGVSPKTFAKLGRFHRALRAAREGGHGGWASIAAAAGYYDQAHLIAEFRAITGVTPRALLGELGNEPESDDEPARTAELGSERARFRA